MRPHTRLGRTRTALATSLLVLTLPGAAVGQAEVGGHGFTPETAPWRDGPWPGVQIASLERSGEGDQASITFWMRLPDGFWIMPHRHPSAKRVNVIRGTILMGHGDSLDLDSVTPIAAGGFALVPRGTNHYEGARGETIVQFSAVGPWATTYVTPGEPYRVIESSARACDADAGFRKLDFWVGDWVVKVRGRQVGTNRIETILDGCAVMEHWIAAGGGEGKSLFYYHPVTQAWTQVWVTGRATAPGGLKEKRLVETLANGGVRFQGEIPLAGGGSYWDRTTLTPLDGGRVGK